MSIESLKVEIRKKAEEESTHIIDTANEEGAGIINQAEEEAKHIIGNKIKENDKNLTEKEKIELSLARIEGRRKILNVKSKYISDVFEEVEKRLRELPEKNPTRYRDILVSYAVEAINNLNGKELFIKVNRHDQKRVNELTEKIKDRPKKSNKIVGLQISPEPINAIGGVIIYTGDKKQYYVNTFESRLTKIKSEDKGRVLEILLGSK
jgi:vacuolar-type H+-ATPase subunit E/Vma4